MKTTRNPMERGWTRNDHHWERELADGSRHLLSEDWRAKDWVLQFDGVVRTFERLEQALSYSEQIEIAGRWLARGK